MSLPAHTGTQYVSTPQTYSQNLISIHVPTPADIPTPTMQHHNPLFASPETELTAPVLPNFALNNTQPPNSFTPPTPTCLGPDDMELTGQSTPSFRSNASLQHALPTTLPTPARALGQLALQTLTTAGETASLAETMEQQTKKLDALHKGMLRSRFHLEAKLKSLTDSTEVAFNNFTTKLIENNNKLEAKMETMMKGIKMWVTEEISTQNAQQKMKFDLWWNNSRKRFSRI